ncbi:hypothetical protein FNV43_RR21286 [Rhamnella rubrinervis]|uniref:Uncharacterized protein n=1 Tax=Rhamnella rubrinervis TaxID=2594499 RepID=A0A8K0E2E7_9ROSA|nr:hypothetical protein FNV43_RR21286 [Rhamnella rubrinervis]
MGPSTAPSVESTTTTMATMPTTERLASLGPPMGETPFSHMASFVQEEETPQPTCRGLSHSAECVFPCTNEVKIPIGGPPKGPVGEQLMTTKAAKAIVERFVEF